MADDPGIFVPAQTPLFHSLEQARYVRQDLLRAIEDRTGRRLIAYVAGNLAAVSNEDILPFGDLLQDVQTGDDLDLLLHTTGGDVDQAERIVMMCRKAIGEGARLRVVVPDSAKSAGTLICLGADAIVMGYCSDLGPIDPQITVASAAGETMRRPAQSFLDGLDEIVARTGDTDLSPAYFPLLDKLDPALIDFCKKAVARSETLARQFLTRWMLSGDEATAEAAARTLNDSREYLSHGAVIDTERAIDLGLVVEVLDRHDDLWEAFWRLYCEMRVSLESPTQRLFEGRKVSLRV